MMNNIIHITTHIGEDMDQMCLFLNSKHIGYRVKENHLSGKFQNFQDKPHDIATFILGDLPFSLIEKTTEMITESCKNIIFHMFIRDKYDQDAI